MKEPKFFVALTSGDTVSSLNGKEHQAFIQKNEVSTDRVSAMYFYPKSLRRYVLFSRSYSSQKHYDFFSNTNSLSSWSDELADTSKLQGIHVEGSVKNTQDIQELFADCGAFQYRDQTVKDACFQWKGKAHPVNAENVMKFYKHEHLSKEHITMWHKIMLCSPDHIVPICVDNTPLTDEESKRLTFNLEQAEIFFEICKPYDNVEPVAVIHGKTKKQRKEQYETLVKMGYTYIAIGGIVPIASKKELVLDLLTDCSDMDNLCIDPDSILGRAKRDGVKVHMFGLCSPIWCQWWYRLGIDSFDGSKIATEGAVNGWYWLPLDNQNPLGDIECKREGRDLPKSDGSEDYVPESLNDLYIKLNVKNMGYMSWKKISPSNPKKVLEFPYDTIEDYIDTISPSASDREMWDWSWDAQKQLLVPKIGLQVNKRRSKKKSKKQEKKNFYIDTSCECPACTCFMSTRCPSVQCWFFKQANPRVRHVADVRMAGSTEHNMGRASHNAFVYEWLLERLREYMKLAEQEPNNSKYKTWRKIDIKEQSLASLEDHTQPEKEDRRKEQENLSQRTLFSLLEIEK
jgi:hypothetical protein